MTHLGLGDEPDLMHNADESCVFCDGRDASRAGADAGTNPHEVSAVEADGSIGWWGTDHGLWLCGWLTETHRSNPSRISDLGVHHIALDRRRQRRQAQWLARAALGRTAAELESDGIGRSRIRFLRDDHDPRLLDGVVHAWLDDDRVVRTRAG